jgi:hypothetical protein
MDRRFGWICAGDGAMQSVKHLLAITIALLPSAALAEQFTPQQLIEVMTKSPSNRDVRVHDEMPPFMFPGPAPMCNLLTARGPCMGAR